jgi:transposase
MIITLMRWPPRRGRNRTGSRTAPKPFLSDSQWLLIAKLFANPDPSPLGGRPRVPPRRCLEGILWVLHAGAAWKDLPERYPSPATCWRRLREWTDSGVFRLAWEKLLGKLDRLQRIDWTEAIGDGSFSRAKRGVPRSAAPPKETAPASS